MFEKIDLTFDGLTILLTGYNQLIREKQKPSLCHHLFLGTAATPCKRGGRALRDTGCQQAVTEFTFSSSVHCHWSDEWET